MQPQPSIQKRGMINNNQNRFSNNGNGNGTKPSNPQTIPPVQYSQPAPHYFTTSQFAPSKLIRERSVIPPNDINDLEMQETLYPAIVEEGTVDLSPEEIERQLAQEFANEQHPQNPNEEEREFHGGKKLYDRQLMQQPMYDEPTMQILNDIASDESFPILVQYITQLSHLGRQAQARLIARAAAFQSKNQVFSNIQNQNDYMMAQDDFAYAQILSKSDYSTYDTNADYFTAEAIMEAQFNIRLRRSRNALNLLQINTQRQESIMGGQHPQQEEERKLSRKIPFLGQYTG